MNKVYGYNNTPTFFFFDCETTGFNPKGETGDRICQLAWQVYNNEFHLITEKSYIIKPVGFTIPEEVSKIHGITNEKAGLEGVEFLTVFAEFEKDLKNCENVVAHNLEFDESFVNHHHYFDTLEKLGKLPEQASDILIGKEKFCTMKNQDIIAFCKLPNPNYRRGRSYYKWPNLRELHSKLFGCSFDNAHDALVDTKATAKCFFELTRLNIILLRLINAQ